MIQSECGSSPVMGTLDGVGATRLREGVPHLAVLGVDVQRRSPVAGYPIIETNSAGPKTRTLAPLKPDRSRVTR